jgi:phosphonate metabolism-associated iron-containing alcohol dehydrogenase
MIFGNPVKVEWGTPDFSWLAPMVGGRHAAVITTKGAEDRGTIELVRGVINQAGLPVVTDVQSNPTIAAIRENAAALLDSSRAIEVIVAVGGGSVLDTAKGIAAIASGGFSGYWFASHLREGAEFPASFAPPPIIAVPTTAGTGSEVTMWGTVWDEVSGAKYSISHPRLYAERAVLVPELTATLPRELTLFTALDALSHCMESIWNKRANAVSEAFATAGIARILPAIGDALTSPGDLAVRRRLQEGALLGGLAISCTATALAHSISYPLTSKLGMPHGLASGFTLPELMRFNADAATDRVLVAARAMNEEDVNAAQTKLAWYFSEWGVAAEVRKYLDEDKARGLAGQLLTPGRAENNVRNATHDDALGIVLRSIRPN